MDATTQTELPGGEPAAGNAEGAATWQPLPQETCDCCGRLEPGWYEKRNDHIADSLGQVTSRRIAAGYGLSEDRVRTIAVEVLGKRAYIDRIMAEEGWDV